MDGTKMAYILHSDGRVAKTDDKGWAHATLYNTAIVDELNKLNTRLAASEAALRLSEERVRELGEAVRVLGVEAYWQRGVDGPAKCYAACNISDAIKATDASPTASAAVKGVGNG